MPEQAEHAAPDDGIEIRLRSKRVGQIATLVGGIILGGSGGGAVGTWLAPQAAAEDIQDAARGAAKEAVEAERRVTDQRFVTVQTSLEAQKEQLDRLEVQNDRQDDKLDRIIDAVKR